MKKLALLAVTLFVPSLAFADEGNAANDMIWLATASALVFLMQAGFALLEAGMSRAKNALNVVMKNYMDVCFGSLIFWRWVTASCLAPTAVAGLAPTTFSSTAPTAAPGASCCSR